MTSQPQSPNESLAIVGGTIYPSPNEAPIVDGVVVVQGGAITAVGPRGSVDVPSDAVTIDGAGRTITAGFWNSHVHFFERKWAKADAIPADELARQLEQMSLRYGFTSVFDTGSEWANTKALRDRVESGEVSGPRIHTTGEALIARDALPSDVVFRVMGLMTFPSPEVSEDSDATKAAKALLEAGVDAIKIHLQAPPPPKPPFPESAIAAAVAEAHRAGRLAFAHPNTGADVLAAVRSGVDVIAHTTPMSGPWDDATLRTMKDGDVALTPTLTLWKAFMRHDRLSVQEGAVQTAVGQLRAFAGAGGTVLFGTDLGAVDYDPSDEYALMAEAGMGFRDILAALTVAPAKRFGEAERLGRIAPGFQADLVVLEGDPANDPRALTDVAYTLRDGSVVYRAN